MSLFNDPDHPRPIPPSLLYTHFCRRIRLGLPLQHTFLWSESSSSTWSCHHLPLVHIHHIWESQTICTITQLSKLPMIAVKVAIDNTISFGLKVAEHKRLIMGFGCDGTRRSPNSSALKYNCLFCTRRLRIEIHWYVPSLIPSAFYF